MKAVAAKLGIGAAETVRTWVRKAEVDAGRLSGRDLGRGSRDQAPEGGKRRTAAGERDPQGGISFLRVELDRPAKRS